MHREGQEIHVDTGEARAGESTGVMRYVLGISLVLAIVALSIVWVIPAVS